MSDARPKFDYWCLSCRTYVNEMCVRLLNDGFHHAPGCGNFMMEVPVNVLVQDYAFRLQSELTAAQARIAELERELILYKNGHEQDELLRHECNAIDDELRATIATQRETIQAMREWLEKAEHLEDCDVNRCKHCGEMVFGDTAYHPATGYLGVRHHDFEPSGCSCGLTALDERSRESSDD